MLNKTDGVTIEVVDTNKKYHSYNDLNLIITNAVPISEPELNSEYVEVKGRNGLIDITTAITGYATYKARHIAINFAAIEDAADWDSRISILRNLFDGKIVKIIFDNDIGYFWTGRCQLTGFERERNCGRFVFDIPQADPFKYTVQTFNEDYLWDPFNFETGISTEYKTHTVDGHLEIVLPKGVMPVVPVIDVISKSSVLTVRKNTSGRYITLKDGTNEIPQIMVNGNEEVTLVFDGNGVVAINFRGASL